MWRHHNRAAAGRPKNGPEKVGDRKWGGKSGRPKIGWKRRKIGPRRQTEEDRSDLTDGCDDDDRGT